MIEFKTQSGSTYEVDTQDKRYRCTNKGLGLASEWVNYDLCPTEIALGNRVTFIMPAHPSSLGDRMWDVHTTTTSPIVEITRNDMIEVAILTGGNN